MYCVSMSIFTSCTVQILIFCEFSPIILMCVFHVAISLAFLSCTLYTIYSGLILRGKFSSADFALSLKFKSQKL